MQLYSVEEDEEKYFVKANNIHKLRVVIALSLPIFVHVPFRPFSAEKGTFGSKTTNTVSV